MFTAVFVLHFHPERNNERTSVQQFVSSLYRAMRSRVVHAKQLDEQANPYPRNVHVGDDICRLPQSTVFIIYVDACEE
jgi:hypothetical protein